MVADLESADFDKVDLRVLHGAEAEDEFDICCEIQVLSNTGIGKTVPRKKKSCSPFNLSKGKANYD